MAGIYIHIPFCKQACYYCNFHFSTNISSIDEMVNAICREAFERKNYLQDTVETIYFGGGTPSLIGRDLLKKIVETLHKNFCISNEAEITLEANPDDISAESLAKWKSLGINRLSIGIQSFFEKHLQWMNRSHSALQAENCIHLAREAGFENFSIDLIYGVPGLSKTEWSENMEKVIALEIPHVSCYALTVEPKTALQKMIIQHKKEDVDQATQSNHFNMLLRKMKQAGYLQYEISNFAKRGFESRHNSSYWDEKKYLGLGPSAHSYNGESRQWNISNNALYLKSIEQSKPCFEIEYLSNIQKLNEYLMTSLRTSTGISLEKIKSLFGESVALEISRDTAKWIEAGKLKNKKDHFILTNKGKFFADGIAADLFREEKIQH
ncbi:MAG: radical SAM family heme chaperone HemW [Chitinophagaceae bacterium]